MGKDFLKKYESEIRLAIREMLNKEKQWEIRRTKDMYKDIYDECIKYNTNANIEANYLPVYISSNYLEEEDQYAHLLFIFKSKKSEVLSLLVYDDAAVLDMTIASETIYKLSSKKKLKKFFPKNFLCDMDLLSLLNIAEEISKSVNILHINFHKKYIDELNTLFSIINRKDMLALLGYYLYVSCYKQYILLHKYYSIINIKYDTKKDTPKTIRSVCSLLYSIIFCKKELPSENVLYADDISTKDSVIKKFKDATKFTYAFNGETVTGKFILVDYSEPSKKNNIYNILDRYADKSKEKHLNKSIIIISKTSNKNINNDMILDINFGDFNDKHYISTKKSYDTLREYISEFEDFIIKKYNSERVINDSPEVTAVKKVSKKIYNSAVIEKYKSNRYAPIILALYDFFDFLRKKYYITQKDYEKIHKRLRYYLRRMRYQNEYT